LTQAQVQKGRKDRPGAGSNSLRIDIPKNDVPEENQRPDGVEYFDGDDDRFSDRRPRINCSAKYSASPANRFRHIRPKRKIIPPEHVVKPTKIRNVKIQDLTPRLAHEACTRVASGLAPTYR
jgi:hypothetical protein